MIATFTALALLLQSPQTPNPDSSAQAAKLLSKMMARYYKAKRIQGTILLTTTAGRSMGQLLTTLQFDDPSKLYIHQELNAENKGTWTIVSDGVVFSYPVPPTQIGAEAGKALFERVQNDGEQRSFREIYAISAAGLKDRSAPLDIAIGRHEDLVSFRNHLSTHVMGQPMQLRGKDCEVVEGVWHSTSVATSKYRVVIAPEGDLMRYELIDLVVDPLNTANTIEIRQTWDVDLHLDAETRQDLYRLGAQQ